MNSTACKTVWIDLDNSPHVPLFAPMIEQLRGNGIDVILTARDHAQTVDLIHLYGLTGTFDVIGRHYGGNKLNKLRGALERARQLVRHLRKLERRPAVALSHGSRSMVLAARWMKVPVITMFDYEHTETHIFSRFSDRVLIPDLVPDEVLNDIGVPQHKRVRHEGLKEEVYLRRFRPDNDFRGKLGREYGLTIDDDTLLITIRPPATTANYHDRRSERVLRKILERIGVETNAVALIVPRTADQADEIKRELGSLSSGRFVFLTKPVNGLDLAFASDLLISGGGTMNREAALLGVPVYSIFAGKLGSIDARMEHEGLLQFIRDETSVSRISITKREASASQLPQFTDRVERTVIEQINSFLRST